MGGGVDLEEPGGREGPVSRRISRDIHAEERRWREDVAKERVEWGVFTPRTLKNGECQNEIKDVERGSIERERESEKWAKVRVDDRLKNEEGEENPV